MAFVKRGSPQEPQPGKALTPWPNASKVLVFKGEGFVPQPVVTNETCGVEGCTGNILAFPNGTKQCQKCLRLKLGPGEVA